MSPPPSSASPVRRVRGDSAVPPLSPADRLLVLQNALLIVLSSWGGGGWLPGVLPAMVAVAALGWLALWLRRREREPLAPIALVPLALWLVLFAISVVNACYTPAAAGGTWLPRAGWISWLPSTVSRSATLQAQLPWFIALSQAGIVLASRLHRRAVRYIWTVAAINGFLLAAVGAAFHFAHSEQMLGCIDTTEQYFFATFFYKNHWAAYGWLGAVAAAAMVVHSVSRARTGDPHAAGRALLFGALGLLTVITLPLPGSRAGVALACLYLFGLPLAVLLARRRQSLHWTRTRIAGATLAVLVAGLTVAFGLDAYANRAREDWKRTVRQLAVASSRSGEAPELRLLISRDTWRMALARPWFGWGVGSFEYIFPLYQGNYLRDDHGRPTARFEFAHDDWLQMFAETGLVGLAVLLYPLGRLAVASWKNGSPAGRVAFAGCATLALYAWIDFPLNNPAVLILWTILLASSGLTANPLPARSPGPAG